MGGTPVVGVTGNGQNGSKVAPIIIAGLTAGGVVVPIQVDANGVLQIAVT